MIFLSRITFFVQRNVLLLELHGNSLFTLRNGCSDIGNSRSASERQCIRVALFTSFHNQSSRLVDGRCSVLHASLFSMSLTLSNPESVDASSLRGPRLSGCRGEVRPRAVQLFVHQRQQLLGPVQQPSAEEQLHPGERRQEGERPVRLVLDREVDQIVVRRRSRELPLLLRVQHFRSSARRHHLPPLLLPRLSVPRPTESIIPLIIDPDDTKFT